MKKLSLILFAILIPAAITTYAQTETVAVPPKKLQQFYLSVGTGPSFNTMEGFKKQGFHLNTSINWLGTSNRIYKTDFSITGFRDKDAPRPGHFMNNIFSHVTIISPSFLFGKNFTINNSFQVKGFAGPSLNLLYFSSYVSPEEAALGEEGNCFPELYLRPGILLRAEKTLWSCKFVGLSAGAYGNFSFLLPSAGVNLNLEI